MRSKIILAGLFVLFLASAAAAADAPGWDVEVLRSDKVFTLQADGSWETKVTEVRKVLTHQAMNAYLGETVIPFREDFQEVEVMNAQTILPDGRKVALPANARIVITPPEAVSQPAFASQRDLVVAHTALEIGAVTELSYLVKTKKGFAPYFEGFVPFWSTFPVQQASVQIRVPRGTPLKTVAAGTGTAFAKTVEGGFDVYTCTPSAVLLLPRERMAAPPASFAPWVSFSTAPDDAAVLRLLQPGELDAAALYRMTERRPAAGSPGLSDVVDLVRKAAALVRPVELPVTVTGFANATPQEVYDQSCGTALDRVRLMAAVLKAYGCRDAGVGALLYANGAREAAPGLSGTAEFLACGGTISGPVYVSAAGNLYLPNDPHLAGKILLTPDGKRHPSAAPEGTGWTLRLNASDWKDKSCHLSGRLSLRGAAVDSGRAFSGAVAYAESVLAEILKLYGVKDLQTTVILASGNAVEASFEAKAEKLFDEDTMALPVPAFLGAWKEMLPLDANRVAPPEVTFPVNLALELHIALPAGKNVEAQPVSARGAATIADSAWHFQRVTCLAGPAKAPYRDLAGLLVLWLSDAENRLVIR